MVWTRATFRTYVRTMALTWRRGSTNRWLGTDDDGQQVGHVGLTVTAGGAETWWRGWRRDGSPKGISVGRFATAEEAMAAVDDAGG
jgi:hypothetical protein